MNYNRFILEPYKGKNTRYHCPDCKKPSTFVRYIDTETDEYLHLAVGRCNREMNCGYHYPPKQFFTDNSTCADNHVEVRVKRRIQPKIVSPKTVRTIPSEVFKQSLQAHITNNFVNFMTTHFGTEYTKQLISRYYIGTSNHWRGATVFYQIDINGKVRAGKIMLYSPVTGKRIKEPYNHLTWVHAILKLPDYQLQQCFFGEHLLAKEPDKPVAIVESEKTAIIASAYLPDFVWLATGSKSGIIKEKCQVLNGRKVVLYPDLNCYDEWKTKAQELGSIAVVSVSDLLEQKATAAERAQGLDLADYLTRGKHREQAKPTSTPYILSNQKEFYYYTFQELIAHAGYDVALQKVSLYQKMSYQYRTCETFVIHNCNLLTSYSNAKQTA